MLNYKSTSLWIGTDYTVSFNDTLMKPNVNRNIKSTHKIGAPVANLIVRASKIWKFNSIIEDKLFQAKLLDDNNNARGCWPDACCYVTTEQKNKNKSETSKETLYSRKGENVLTQARNVFRHIIVANIG